MNSAKKLTRSQRLNLWNEYVRVMTEAHDAALAFANAIEKHLRVGPDSTWYVFQDACTAGDQFASAAAQAAPYHFASIPGHGSGAIINFDEDDLLALMRDLRGAMQPVTIVAADGTKLCGMIPSEDGIAGFYTLELRSMTPFGLPRRRPDETLPA